ncbi:glycosyltransferase family 2 protein [Providencia alcalifaciens]|uniref:glycosyltransferase family 2 protein n=1 Tax=Providencia alcalifaciens TaxID=126385 RepID=UPI0003E229AA|nr:glycosyltransferase family 2 protein [Providencia alcalifaciens]ETT01309.1 hypothetical protein HMPREF1568_3388 [Providencia alcalifaciens PAL-3]EUC99086.1 hypothetical protein HMPREF1566_0786 [Providencia alcalifaciens PAL-1]
MIIIPMAGMSSRFFSAGFKKPKYMLEAHGKTLFEHSVNSFKNYFSTEFFLFIIRDIFDTEHFIKEKIKLLGIRNYHIEILPYETKGQAETVAIGLNQLEKKGINYSGSITIFNIDSFRFNFLYPDISTDCDGYLEVFIGKGENWSFAKPKSATSNEIIETAEKKAISNLCSTGLYFFKEKSFFLDSFYEYSEKPLNQWDKGELYIAPLYNMMIEKGLTVKYNLINLSEIIFCGTPTEYNEFLKLDYHI